MIDSGFSWCAYSSLTSVIRAFTSNRLTCIVGVRAYSLNAFTICFIASTCWMIVCVARSSRSASPDARAEILAAQPLGRKLDRRQRVLDLVREAARDFAPGRLALRLQQRRDVVEHDGVTGRAIAVAGQLRARAHQHAADAVVAQLDLLAPFALTAAQVLLSDVEELREQRPRARELHDRFADALLEVHAENRARGLVRRANPQIRLERHHAGRQAREDQLELAALRLHLLLARTRFGARLRESLRHVVERVHEEADLVARGCRHARGKVAPRHRARALHQKLNRHDEPPREEKGAVDGREQRDQQNQAQSQRERVLQRRAQERALAELVVALEHVVRERADALLQRVRRHHELELAACRGRLDRGRRDDLVFGHSSAAGR